jgi:hypothetical protein
MTDSEPRRTRRDRVGVYRRMVHVLNQTTTTLDLRPRPGFPCQTNQAVPSGLIEW